MGSFPAQNEKVITELEALIERLGYGILDTTFEIHNKRVTNLVVFGKKRLKYNKDNLVAMQDLAKRVAKAQDNKETTRLTVTIDIRNGFIEEMLILSRIILKYEQNEATSANTT